MRIALNTTAFMPGRMGGVEIYLRQLQSSLQDLDSVNHYSLVTDAHHVGEFPVINPNFQVVQCNYTKPSLMWLARGLIRNTIGADILRPVMNRLQVDVIHHPFSFLNPLKLSIPSVLTYHDMQHEYYPEFFSRAELRRRREFDRASAHEAVRVIAISQHVRECLVELYGVDPAKIDVVYNGSSPHFRLIKDPASLEVIKKKYGLAKPFLYYPAATWPHKNHRRLLQAIRIVIDRYGFDGDLVLTGISMHSQGEIVAAIAKLGLEQTVKVLGYLPYAELPLLYNEARGLVFPSLFEGFGIPLVEAMACGCPIACSCATSIPEVVGDAGVIFDPLSVEDMAEKIWALWSDEPLRGDLEARGLARAELFSWERTARETIKVYEKAGGVC